MHHAVMRICIFLGFPLYLPENGFFFGGVEGEDVKILSSNPQQALPFMREYASVGVSRVKIGPLNDFAYKERKKKTEW